MAGIRSARVVVVGNPDLAAAERGQAMLRADRATTDVLDAIHDPAVEVVVIATPTSTHSGLIEAALRAGKAVWSEKPIALDLAETSRVVALWRETGLPVELGFMRRFDPGYVRAEALIDAGEIGRIEQFHVYSRDTYPPSVDFLKTSGGSFLDMSIHDFDLARFLVGEVDEVQAWGSVVFDERFAAVGDVDTAVTMLRFQNGALGVVEMSRHSEWGYDIQTEVAGALSKVVVEAHQKTSAIHSRRFGFEADHYENFPDRFEVAFRVELETFSRTLRRRRHTDARTRGRPRDPPAGDRRDPELAREPAICRRHRSMHGRGLGVTDRVVHHVRPGPGPGTLLEITPPSVGWRYLSFRVIQLGPGETIGRGHRRPGGGDRAAGGLRVVHLRWRDPLRGAPRRVLGEAPRRLPAAEDRVHHREPGRTRDRHRFRAGRGSLSRPWYTPDSCRASSAAARTSSAG